jgi:anti-sigma factor RsiW
MKCPSFERLIDYLDRRLPEAEAAGVAAHLATSCADCAEIRDWYQLVRKVAATDDTVAPPPWC